jgi:hypothetical protein
VWARVYYLFTRGCGPSPDFYVLVEIINYLMHMSHADVISGAYKNISAGTYNVTHSLSLVSRLLVP